MRSLSFSPFLLSLVVFALLAGLAAAEGLRRIAELYAVEKRIRGQPAEARQRARAAESRPLIEAMKPWLEGQLRRVPPRG